MNNFAVYRTADRWSKTLEFFLSFTFMIVWLPFIRSLFDGESYEWGTVFFGSSIHGKGLTPSFAFLVIQLIFYAALFIGLYRMKNRTLYFALLILWWINVFGNFLFDIIVNGDTVFHGDTLNVHLSISMIVIPLSVLALLLLIMIFRTEGSNRPDAPASGTSRNRLLLRIFLVSLPIVFILLFFGVPHGTTDQIGVIIVIIQCFYIPRIFRPYDRAIS